MKVNTFDELYYKFSNHYIHKNGKAKYDKINSKVRESKHTEKLFNLSTQNKWLPNEGDFCVTISNTTYFMFAGFETTAMGEIIAMNLWQHLINRNYNICADHELLEKGLRALDRWKINI